MPENNRMPENNKSKTEEFLLEIKQLIETEGIRFIFQKFTEQFERVELLEQTHEQIMKLPLVLKEFQSLDKTSNNKTNNDTNINYLTDRIHKLEEKFESIIPILDKLLHTVENLCSQSQKSLSFDKPTIVSSSENENIQIEIKEEGVEEESDEEEESDKEEEEESDEEEEESDEEKEEVETDKEEEEESDEEKEEEESDEEKEEEESDEEKEDVETENEESEEELEEEEELFEIEIDDVTYCTNNDENGFIYQLLKDGDVGEKIGYFKDSEPFFYADEK